jgi:hypothetical protein
MKYFIRNSTKFEINKNEGVLEVYIEGNFFSPLEKREMYIDVGASSRNPKDILREIVRVIYLCRFNYCIADKDSMNKLPTLEKNVLDTIIKKNNKGISL